MRVLVTGGAGFIGSHVARLLREREKADVTVLDNLSVGQRGSVPDGCRLVVGDLNDPMALARALDGIDTVVHLAAFVSIRGSFERPEEDLRTNCCGTLSLFRASVDAGVKKIVFASSMAVYGEPTALPVSEGSPTLPGSPYGLSKLRGEMWGRILAAKYGIEFAALRYFNTYGQGQTPSDYVGVITTFVACAVAGRPMTVYGDGEQTRDFVWVEDVAQATLLAIRQGVQGVFNVGSGREVSINEIARLVQRSAGGRIVHVTAPPGEVRRMCADISRARRLLGYAPRGQLEEQIPLLVQHWRSRQDRSPAAGSRVTAGWRAT